MIEHQLPDVDTPTAYDDVITTGRTRARRRTAVIAAAAATVTALALAGLVALHQDRKPEIVAPPFSPVDLIAAETPAGLQLVDPRDGSERFAPDKDGTYVSWSPDGGQIAYVVPASDDSSRDLWTASVTTQVKHRVAHCAGCKVVAADWSPDGADLAYTVLLPNGRSELRVVAGGATGTMIALGTGGWGWPQWSPDGTTIALGEEQGARGFIDLLPVDRSPLRGPTPKAGPPQRIAGPIEGVKRLSWSPDGRRIAFTAGAQDMTPGFTSDLYVVNADGSGTRQLTHSPTGTRIFAVEWETGNPDQPFLVSIAENGVDYSEAHLALVSSDGSRVAPVYAGGSTVKAFRAAYRF
ncbi:hypothetical protein GCM10009798_26680 [Nocardioides panacihumi]|uniref:WD40 repeat protein n=1 Tax=Nocardioides panacihumi TaxID=400774 RepID=A0ABP5CJR6_9ACTN